jgi:gas vesicle protein
MRDNGKVIGGAFLLGGVAGAVIALLYAPQSGSETRRDISRTARRIGSNAADLIEETMEDVNEFASDLKEKTSDVIGRGKELTEKTVDEILSTLDHGQRAIMKQQKKLKKALGL